MAKDLRNLPGAERMLPETCWPAAAPAAARESRSSDKLSPPPPRMQQASLLTQSPEHLPEALEQAGALLRTTMQQLQDAAPLLPVVADAAHSAAELAQQFLTTHNALANHSSGWGGRQHDDGSQAQMMAVRSKSPRAASSCSPTSSEAWDGAESDDPRDCSSPASEAESEEAESEELGEPQQHDEAQLTVVRSFGSHHMVVEEEAEAVDAAPTYQRLGSAELDCSPSEGAGSISAAPSRSSSRQDEAEQARLRGPASSLPLGQSFLAEAVADELTLFAVNHASTRSSSAASGVAASAVAADEGAPEQRVADETTCEDGAAASCPPSAPTCPAPAAEDVTCVGAREAADNAMAAAPSCDALAVGFSAVAEQVADEIADGVASAASSDLPAAADVAFDAAEREAMSNADDLDASADCLQPSISLEQQTDGSAESLAPSCEVFDEAMTRDAKTAANTAALQHQDSTLAPGLSVLAEGVADDLAAAVAEDALRRPDSVGSVDSIGNVISGAELVCTAGHGSDVPSNLEHNLHELDGPETQAADDGLTVCAEQRLHEGHVAGAATHGVAHGAYSADAEGSQHAEGIASQSSLDASVVNSTGGWSQEAEAVVDELAAGLSLQNRLPA